MSALILANFSGSCDTRPTATTPGECRAWYGSTTTAASQACTDLGGTFNEVERCPSTGRVLRCAIEDPAPTIMYSYYAPTYTEASAAEALQLTQRKVREGELGTSARRGSRRDRRGSS